MTVVIFCCYKDLSHKPPITILPLLIPFLSVVACSSLRRKWRRSVIVELILESSVKVMEGCFPFPNADGGSAIWFSFSGAYIHPTTLADPDGGAVSWLPLSCVNVYAAFSYHEGFCLRRFAFSGIDIHPALPYIYGSAFVIRNICKSNKSKEGER